MKGREEEYDRKNESIFSKMELVEEKLTENEKKK